MEGNVGASYLTTIFGVLVILGDVAKLVADGIKEQGMPTDLSSWITFAAGLAAGVGIILSKSFNVSNSPTPAAPVTVGPVAMSKPNPSATVAPGGHTTA
jgi:hypothetical protein